MKYLTIALFIVACNNKPLTRIASVDASRVGKIKKVLIIGNSIVRHPPRPEIGWNNNWGMAASALDSDFVHILQRELQPYGAELKFENLADFERGYKTFDFDRLDSFTSFKPDLIVVRLAENVDDSAAVPDNFISHYDTLLHRLDPVGNAVKVICGGWWYNANINRLLRNYAQDNDYTFLDQAILNNDSTIATGQFKNRDVGIHPNNLGMRMIANDIWSVIAPYFMSKHTNATVN
jgi:hypothetical protein